MDIKTFKRLYGLTDADIGEMFGYKNYASYYNSARRKHIENGIVRIIELIKQRTIEIKEEN